MKVIFEIASLEDTVNIIKDFYYQDEKEVHQTKKHLFGYYPELNEIDKNLSKDEKDKIIFKIVEKEYNRLYDKMTEKQKYFTLIWQEYNDKFIAELSNYLNTPWHTFKDYMTGYIAPVPIFPRYPKYLSFVFSPNITDEKMIEVTAHECTHFLWFKKISEINNTEYNNYSSDEWEYSELVVDPILNSKEMNDVLHINEKAYPYFYEQEFNGEKIMDHIKKIYEEDISIEEKITRGFDYYKEFLKSKRRAR